MKTILITGATGYLGTALTKNFLDKNFFIIALALNRNEKFLYESDKNCKVYYLSEESVEEIFAENNIDIVIHTATLYGRNNEKSVDMEKANVEFPVSVLSAAAAHKVKLFINTGTILASGLNAYSLTKSHFADWLDLYADKIKCVNLKLDHFYGPYDKPVKFIVWIFEQLRNNVPEIDLTEGSQTRDFIYIDDVVAAFETVVMNEDKLNNDKVTKLEVGTNNKTSIRDIVLMIKEELHNTTTKLNFGAVPFRKNEVLDYEVDSWRLRCLGWTPKYTSVRDGIRKIIEIENGVK